MLLALPDGLASGKGVSRGRLDFDRECSSKIFGRLLAGLRTTREPIFILRDLRAAEANQCKIRKIKLAISTMAVTPVTESTNACVAAWWPTLSLFIAKIRSKMVPGRVRL
jgi:hypothetical protein